MFDDQGNYILPDGTVISADVAAQMFYQPPAQDNPPQHIPLPEIRIRGNPNAPQQVVTPFQEPAPEDVAEFAAAASPLAGASAGVPTAEAGTGAGAASGGSTTVDRPPPSGLPTDQLRAYYQESVSRWRTLVAEQDAIVQRLAASGASQREMDAAQLELLRRNTGLSDAENELRNLGRGGVARRDPRLAVLEGQLDAVDPLLSQARATQRQLVLERGELEADSAMREAELLNQLAADMGGAIEEERREQAALQHEYEQSAARVQGRIAELADAASIDPSRLFADAGSAIAAAISVAAGAIGAAALGLGVPGSSPENMALTIIQRAIDRDVAAQVSRANILGEAAAREQGAMAALLEVGAQGLSARSALRAAQTARAARLLEAAAARARSPEERNAARQVASILLQRELEERQRSLQEQYAALAARRRGGGGSRRASRRTFNTAQQIAQGAPADMPELSAVDRLTLGYFARTMANGQPPPGMPQTNSVVLPNANPELAFSAFRETSAEQRNFMQRRRNQADVAIRGLDQALAITRNWGTTSSEWRHYFGNLGDDEAREEWGRLLAGLAYSSMADPDQRQALGVLNFSGEHALAERAIPTLQHQWDFIAEARGRWQYARDSIANNIDADTRLMSGGQVRYRPALTDADLAAAYGVQAEE